MILCFGQWFCSHVETKNRFWYFFSVSCGLLNLTDISEILSKIVLFSNRKFLVWPLTTRIHRKYVAIGRISDLRIIQNWRKKKVEKNGAETVPSIKKNNIIPDFESMYTENGMHKFPLNNSSEGTDICCVV